MRPPGDYWVVYCQGKSQTQTVATYNGTDWSLPKHKNRVTDDYFKEIENQPIKPIKSNF